MDASRDKVNKEFFTDCWLLLSVLNANNFYVDDADHKIVVVLLVVLCFLMTTKNVKLS